MSKIKSISFLLIVIIALSAQSVYAVTKIKAKQIEIDTTNLDGNLSSADDTVQKAIETIDEMTSAASSTTEAELEAQITDVSDIYTSNDGALFDGDFSSLSGVPSGLSDGDDDTTYSAGTGIDITGTTISSTVTDTTLNETTVDSYADNNNYLDLDTYPNADTDSTDDFGGAWSDLTGDAIIDGDLTVDTDTLYVDSSGDMVGINAVPTSRQLQIGTGNTTNVAGFSDDRMTVGYEVSEGAAVFDTNSKPYKFQVSNDNKIIIGTDGKVGVGNWDSEVDRLLKLRPTADSEDVLSIVNDSNSAEVFVAGTTSDRGYLEMRNSSNSAKVRIDTGGDTYFSGGNVGIGDTTPDATLDVAGDGAFDDDVTAEDFETNRTWGSVSSLVNKQNIGWAALGEVTNTLRGKTVVAFEYWNGSAWVDWTGITTGALNDGDKTTGINIDNTHAKFRVTWSGIGWNRGFAIGVCKGYGSGGYNKPYTVLWETSSDNVSYTARYNENIGSSAYQDIYFGLSEYGDSYHRMTVDYTTNLASVTVYWMEVSFYGYDAGNNSTPYQEWGATGARIIGDLKVSGDDLYMATNTDGAILVANGTNFNPVVMSGGASIASDGTVTLGSIDDLNDVNTTSAISGQVLKYNGSTWVADTDNSGTSSGSDVWYDAGTSVTLTPSGTTDDVVIPNDLTVDGTTLYVDSGADRVGIGTSSPDSELDIDDGGGNSGSPAISFNDERVTIGFDGAAGIGYVGASSGKAIAIRTNGITNEVARFDADGNLGVGTTSPSATLDIEGDAVISDKLTIDDIVNDGDIRYFYDQPDVGDEEDGNSVYFYRKADEADDYVRMYIRANRDAQLQATNNWSLTSSNGSIFMSASNGQTYLTGNTSLGVPWGSSGNNPEFKKYGYITDASSVKYVKEKVNDTSDKYEITRQDSNILGMDIQMPVEMNSATIDGDVQIEGDLTIWNSVIFPSEVDFEGDMNVTGNLTADAIFLSDGTEITGSGGGGDSYWEEDNFSRLTPITESDIKAKGLLLEAASDADISIRLSGDGTTTTNWLIQNDMNQSLGAERGALFFRDSENSKNAFYLQPATGRTFFTQDVTFNADLTTVGTIRTDYIAPESADNITISGDVSASQSLTVTEVWIDYDNLPSSDPEVKGKVWRKGNSLQLSSGEESPTTWIGSYDGTNTDAITGQVGWGGTTTTGGWNSCPTTSGSDVSYTVTHNLGWDINDAIVFLQVKNSDGDIQGNAFPLNGNGSGTEGVYFAGATSNTVPVVFRDHRINTTNWSNTWSWRIIVMKVRD
jgi:hypothetical protein